jgi:hypothetical protein
VIGFANAENKITLQHALDFYVQQLGVSVDTTGTPEETWDKVKKAKDELPRRPSFLSSWRNIAISLIDQILSEIAGLRKSSSSL